MSSEDYLDKLLKQMMGDIDPAQEFAEKPAEPEPASEAAPENNTEETPSIDEEIPTIGEEIASIDEEIPSAGEETALVDENDPLPVSDDKIIIAEQVEEPEQIEIPEPAENSVQVEATEIDPDAELVAEPGIPESVSHDMEIPMDVDTMGMAKPYG